MHRSQDISMIFVGLNGNEMYIFNKKRCAQMDDDTRCEIETSRKCFLNEKTRCKCTNSKKEAKMTTTTTSMMTRKKNCAAAKMQTRNGRRLRVGIFGRAQRYIFRATIEICCSLNTKMTLKKPISIS